MDLTTPAGIDAYLLSTPFKDYQNAQRLSEGSSGFVYRIYLREGEHDESIPSSLIVKHVEGYAARANSWKMDQSRLKVEVEALQLLAQLEFQIHGRRVPKVLHFDEASWVLIMEDVGSLPSLKGWAQPGAVGLEDVKSIAKRLGTFLARVHNVTANNTLILEQFSCNETGKNLSSTLYFANLPQAAEKSGHSDDFLRQAANQGQNDTQNGSEVLTLGDFWTGNILVSEKLELFVLDLELAKPGTADFDLGQMAAEMYCIAAFRERELGMAMLNAFLESYRDSRHGDFDVTKVAIRIGAHLIIIAPSAWAREASEAQIKNHVDVGVELIRQGIGRDEDGLKGSIVQKLFC